ncbi:unknown [Fusobacterium nucleatum subsp. nucleatum ATCC 25586]|uniref:Uncharacterized protein n=1 Tax=Fusobacterium nucleatum subsp. nucleatum (strain ATCC 25586 / DSM 15643 / BCRC 10681 / CIP 101130 / JCM 8532 / KCTC 2640 / LMG 13131 / VPI 4355) TaxID=190304 RepID=Q8RFW4_FUSNN|nr:unknown [Fusobacterium nucleatum subsp. nucleatum ATCC 25586]
MFSLMLLLLFEISINSLSFQIAVILIIWLLLELFLFSAKILTENIKIKVIIKNIFYILFIISFSS